jgi:ATP-binding cassette, subfamily B, bacterial MsbA
LIRDSLVLVGLIGFLIYTAWELAVMVFLCFPFLIFAVRRISNRLRSSSTSMQARVGRVSGFVQEALLGLREIKIFNASIPQEKRFFELNQNLRKEEMRIVRTSALAGPLVSLMTALTVAIVIYLASSMTVVGKLTPGEFVAFITALAMIFGPLRRLTAVNIVLQKGLAAADVIFELIDTPDERGEVNTERTLTARHEFGEIKDTSPGRVRGDIIFDHVTFSYPSQAYPAVRELSFRISSGEAVALLGPSGSGKSSVLALLARFYSPSSGDIFIDGLSLRNWDLDELRGNLALVGQNVVLFDDTVGNNIRFGRESASDEEVYFAAKSAHAWEFIERLPKKLDTPIGSLGERLSGGQRQRIAIARAFLKDAPILLLDEATSALDRESEEAVLDGLERLIQGRTVLMVSHSPERLRGVTRTIDLGALKGSSTGA